MNWLQRLFGAPPRTAGEMMAYSMRHPATRDDWRFLGDYPFRFENEKIGQWAAYRHTGNVDASVPLTGSDQRDLLGAMKGLQRAGNALQLADALESFVERFERAYGTGEQSDR